MTSPQPEPAARLLEAVGAATVAARAEPFAVRERFEAPSGIRFATIWTGFKRQFYGKVEAPAPEIRLRKYKLLRIAPDAPIIAELGGAAAVEAPVAAAHALMRLQGAGADGILQVNGYANIFYSRDLKGALCAVRIGWDGEGWVIDAIPVDDPLAWNGKHEIFAPAPAAP